MKKRALTLWTALATFIGFHGMAFADYIDNDGVADLSAAASTLKTTIFSVGNQVMPIVIAIVTVVLIYRIFKKFAR